MMQPSPRALMSKRGIALNNEFRYLGPISNGTALLDILPSDLDTGHPLAHVVLHRSQFWLTALPGRLDYNRVSDDAYFRDLGNNLNLTSRTNLLQQARVTYTAAIWVKMAR